MDALDEKLKETDVFRYLVKSSALYIHAVRELAESEMMSALRQLHRVKEAEWKLTKTEYDSGFQSAVDLGFLEIKEEDSIKYVSATMYGYQIHDQIEETGYFK